MKLRALLLIYLVLAATTGQGQVQVSDGGSTSGGAGLLGGTTCQITTASLPPGTIGLLYDTFIQTSGCTAPLSFSIVSGSFPSWATLNPVTGEISGIAAVVGANSFTIQTTDGTGRPSNNNPALTISIAANGGGPALPDPALLNWPTSMASTPTSNVTVCVGAPVNAALLPGGVCAQNLAATAAGLTSALSGAACGQVINISPGTFGAGLLSPYAGAFNFPNIQCPNNNWLWVSYDLSNPNFPAEGTRVDPCYAGIPQNKMRHQVYPLADGHPNTCVRSMPQFMCNILSGASCWGWPQNANVQAGNHIRFIGIDFTRDNSFDTELALFDFDYQPTPACALVGSGNNALPAAADQCQAVQPGFIIMDRCLYHGHANRQTEIGLKLAGATWVAVIDSYAYDFGVTYAGGAGDGHFYGGGTGHGYTGVGHWKFVNTYSESSTMSNEFCGAFDEPLSPITHADGTPADVAWQLDYFWKKPLWDPSVGQAHNSAVTIEGQTYGPSPAQEFSVSPSAVSVKQGNQQQINTLLLWDTNAGINRVAGTPTVDGVAYTSINSANGILVKNGEHTVGTVPFSSQNQITWTYVACSGAGAPVAACTGATTPGAHTVKITASTISNVLATQGNSLSLSATATITVTAAAPAAQISITPKSPTLSIQPSYSDIYFNVRDFCVTVFAFPNSSPASISWTVDGVANGNATVGTIVHIGGSSFSGTSPSSAAYCSGTGLGNHTIVVTDSDGASDTSVINVSTNAVIYAYDLRAFISKNAWELKCGSRVLLEKVIAQVSWGGSGNGGGQPGNWFLTQVGNQANQVVDGSGANVGYGPQHINDVTIRYYHGINMASGMVIASLNAALGVHRVDVSNSICENCDYTWWMNGWQKRSNVLQLSGTSSITKVLPWTSPTSPLADNITVRHVTFLGPTTSVLSLTNDIVQFGLGSVTFKDNIWSSPGSTTFFNSFGDTNDANQAIGSGSSNTEALAFQGAGWLAVPLASCPTPKANTTYYCPVSDRPGVTWELSANAAAYSPYAPPNPAPPGTLLANPYVFDYNVLMDSTALLSVFSSTHIYLPAATAVGFVNYPGELGGDYRLCSGFHTPSVLCTAASPYAAGQPNQADDGTDQGADAANQAIYDLAIRTGTRTP